jgi:hypothetical protein
MTAAETKVLDLSIAVMEATGGLDIHAARTVDTLVDLERQWGAAVRELIAERQ